LVVLAVIALLRVCVLHGNSLRLRLGLLLLMLHLLMLLLLLRLLVRCCHGCRVGATLLILHLLLLLLDLEMWWKVDESALTHLLPHGRHLLRIHILHLVREAHAHAAMLLRKHCLLLLRPHESLLLGVHVLLSHGGVYVHLSRQYVQHEIDEKLTHSRMLLLLREHVGLLRLQMRQRMRVRASHTRRHAHHGPSLAHRAIWT
jgi:hypothetical protein